MQAAGHIAARKVLGKAGGRPELKATAHSSPLQLRRNHGQERLPFLNLDISSYFTMQYCCASCNFAFLLCNSHPLSLFHA